LIDISHRLSKDAFIITTLLAHYVSLLR